MNGILTPEWLIQRIENGPRPKQGRSNHDTQRQGAVIAGFEHKKTSGQAAQNKEIIGYLVLDNGKCNKSKCRTDENRKYVFHIQTRQKYNFALEMDKITEKKEADKRKRQQARWAKMDAGTQELTLWLRDLARKGLAALPERPKSYFDSMAQRLVDAQCAGLAATVRELRDLEYRSGDQWQQQATDLVVRLWAVAQAFGRLYDLPPTLQSDVRSFAGWGPGPKDVLADPEALAVQDTWLVAGRTTEVIEGITTQRNWLLGLHTGHSALVLNFAYKTQPIATTLVPGQAFEGELAFFPASVPQRAVVRQQGPPVGTTCGLQPLPYWAEAETHMAGILTQQPLVEQFVVLVQGLVPFYHAGKPALADSHNFVLALADQPDELAFLRLLALSGGHPLDMLLLLDRGQLCVLGCFNNDQYVLILSN